MMIGAGGEDYKRVAVDGGVYALSSPEIAFVGGFCRWILFGFLVDPPFASRIIDPIFASQ